MLSRIHTERESQKGGREGKQEGGSNRERMRVKNRWERVKEVTKGKTKETYIWVSKEKINMHKT